MAKQIPWCKPFLDEFIKLGCLTYDEQKIIKTRVAGWSITKQAMEFGMSVSTVNRVIARLKQKYDNCQKYSEILPPRRTSAMAMMIAEMIFLSMGSYLQK